MQGTPQDTAGHRRRRRTGVPRQNGPAIKALREKDGWTQTALAKHVGIRQASLSAIESETASAYVTTLNRIARALCVPVGAITRTSDGGTVVDLTPAGAVDGAGAA